MNKASIKTIWIAQVTMKNGKYRIKVFDSREEMDAFLNSKAVRLLLRREGTLVCMWTL